MKNLKYVGLFVGVYVLMQFGLIQMIKYHSDATGPERYWYWFLLIFSAGLSLLFFLVIVKTLIEAIDRFLLKKNSPAEDPTANTVKLSEPEPVINVFESSALQLTIDAKTGDPIIKFRHMDRSEDLEHLLLKRFIELSKENGIQLYPTRGETVAGTDKSYLDYEISPIKK